MKDSEKLDFFQWVKCVVESSLDRNGWQWSMSDSQLLDWAIQNMEATHGH